MTGNAKLDKLRQQYSSNRKIDLSTLLQDELPLVSIVTPSFNQGKFIEKTILSVLEQNYPMIEYIVMDAQSTDETAAVLGRHRHRISQVICEKDKGQADAINKGFKLAHGEILAYLNADDCYASAATVKDAVMELVKHSDVDLIYGRHYYVSEDGCFLMDTPFRKFDAERIWSTCFIPQECCFWTREIFDRSGGYTDADFHYAMDYEMWLRFLSHGAKFKAIDALYGLYRWHSSAKSLNTWSTVGVAECHKLQLKYLKRIVFNEEMQMLFWQHVNGFERRKYEPQAILADRMQNELNRVRRKSFNYAPLDTWVYANPDTTWYQETLDNARKALV